MILKLVREGFLFALSALWGNRLRTVLSLLGITIGIFAVISVFTFVDSWEMRIRSSLSSLGDDVVYLEKWPWQFGSSYPWWKYMNRPVASYKEFEMLQDRTQTARVMTMTTNVNGGVAKAGNLSLNSATVKAVSHDYQVLREFEISKGRYFSPNESQLGSRVVVLGASVADALFPNIDPTNKQVLVMGQKLTVIGVLAQEGNNAINMSIDNEFLVPINMVRRVRGGDFGRLYPIIMVQPKSGIPVAELKAELTGHMRAIRRIRPTEEDNFALNQISFLANQLGQLFSALTVIGWLVGGFSILVGGFGIANIMFVSVYERTSQIGIQKALGAKNYFILLQFLIESVVLSLMGGVLGLLVVWIMTLIATYGFDTELTLTLGNILLAVTVSVVIGVIAGLLPALRASRMDPVEAIRFN
ncbi:MAG: ABC transporter permease [Sphingobacteriaceae bacterium]|nr:ABC transporter permease [Sphingobacteriaceae bacterium]